MATTTNYGWTTPDDTALVKDGAAAIRTLGSSVDTTTKALNPSTTLGDIEYRSSTANTNTRLPIGTTGQSLIVSGGVPAWGTPAGGGKVLQVVMGSSSTSTTVTSTTHTDSGLSVSITPSSATSKVLILVSQQLQVYSTAANNAAGWRLVRGSTSIFDGTGTSNRAFQLANVASEANKAGYYAMNYLDSPATTSSTTYKTQTKVQSTANSQMVVTQDGSALSTIIALEIGA
jgi:hypothetical protein